jgi:quercetin dioxygenase-like cupin family protein
MEIISGNILIRPNLLPKVGDRIEGHAHNFDHTSIVIRGAVHVVVLDPAGGAVQEGDFKAGEHFLVKAGVEHEITATEPDTLFHCVYSHRTPQGDVVQEYTGWEKAHH